MKDQLLQFMQNEEYSPMSKSELARALEIPSRQRQELRDCVEALENEGLVVRLQKGRYGIMRKKENLVPGMIRILRSGKILFLPEQGSKATEKLGWDTDLIPEVELPPNMLVSALDGDRVDVRVERRLPRTRRIPGRKMPVRSATELKVKVARVTERSKSIWLGVYRTGKVKPGFVQGDGVTAPRRIALAEAPRTEVFPGQLVTVKITDFGDGKKAPMGIISEVLGYADDPHVDMEAMIRKYDLPTVFPSKVLQEAESLSVDISDEERSRREDWTNRTVITIDPDTAKDFDDAIAVEETEQGWRLAVHIADVSHFVLPGSALDTEAKKRGNSTYLPDRVLPMLPPHLSDYLCSLRPGEQRLTKLCELHIDWNGKVLSSRFADAIIKSKARLTYREALKMIRGDGDGEVPELVRLAWKLASVLRKKRYDQGALDLDFPEVKMLLDDEGRTIGVETEEYDESHQLIEECMLAANEAVALTLKNKNRPAIYRVHEAPEAGKLFEFAQLCREYGHPVHDINQRGYLNELMNSIKDSPDEQLLKLALLKSLMRARYDVSPLGHYGLATANYCHFTSPIRRYADLVVHRSLNPLMPNPPAWENSKLGAIAVLEQTAEHISETERISAAAEKEAERLKLFEWLESQCYAENPDAHMALITAVKPFGVLLELPKLQLKGLIKPEKLPKKGGSWRYEPFADRWKNKKGSIMSVGMKLSVVPIRVDREQQWVDFAPANSI